MKKLSIILLLAITTNVFAQQETFDIATFTVSTGWKKEVATNNVVFSTTNNIEKTWYKIGIYKVGPWKPPIRIMGVQILQMPNQS
jgi:hypothetical protein